MSAHTPGPWALAKGADEYVCSDGHWIASTMGVRGTDEARANARLIAAAPDLLAALEQLCSNAELCRFMIDTGEDEGKAVVASALFDTIYQARAAIALATGETPR